MKGFVTFVYICLHFVLVLYTRTYLSRAYLLSGKSFSPLHPHRCTPSPLHPHRCTPSPLHPLTAAPSPLHPHRCTLIAAPSSHICTTPEREQPPHRVARRGVFLSKSKKKILFGAYIYALKAFETKKQTAIRIYCRLPFIIESETRIYYLSKYIYIIRCLLFLRRGRVAIKRIFVGYYFYILQESCHGHDLHIENINIILTDIAIVLTRRC